MCRFGRWCGVRRLLIMTFALVSLHGAALAEPLRVGTKAPSFTLKDQHGKEFHLQDLLGKRYIVLAFYVKAFTRG